MWRLLILLLLAVGIEAYPTAFQYECYYHPLINGNTYVCPIDPVNCTTLPECRQKMNKIMKSTPYVGIVPTKLALDGDCTSRPDNQLYFKLLDHTEIRFCNTTANVFSSDLDCSSAIRCYGYQNCSSTVCSQQGKHTSFFLMLVQKF